ncbi:MAG: manganese efflux pump MntP family protein [Bacteroidales bacterium]|nr:manganese efflux pump MntP family protein [Bacteroidales bacterium]
MTILDILLIAVALGMDCFTVSVVSGVMMRKLYWGRFVRMSFLFGLFQALMPLIGWFAIHYFQSSIEAYDHWIAFGLLFLIGAKMIVDSFKSEEEATFNPLRFWTQITLAVATSIDALAVGISFSCSGYCSVSSLTLPLLVIGVVSFVMSIVGVLLGVRFGGIFTRRFKPEIIGGIILIAIGVKILLEHLLV